MLPLHVRVDLGTMPMKVYSTLSRSTRLEPRHKIVSCHKQDTRWGLGLSPRQICSRCILQLLPTGLHFLLIAHLLDNKNHLFLWLYWLMIYSHYFQVSWGCRIHRPPLTSVLDMTLNNLMVRFQWCWSFGKCGAPLHYHRSQVHSDPEW